MFRTIISRWKSAVLEIVFIVIGITINRVFYRNDGPYEVLKSKGFDLISDDSFWLDSIEPIDYER